LFQFVLLVLMNAGQGALVIVFDWMFAPVWGVAFVIVGWWAARRALRAGRFGPVSAALSGIGLVAVVSAGAFALAIGLPPAPEIYEPLLYSAHLGMVYGSLAGFLFWRIITGREAGLLPPGRPRYRRNATRVFAALLCLYGIAVPLIIVTLV
jgi:hypothetical protein